MRAISGNSNPISSKALDTDVNGRPSDSLDNFALLLTMDHAEFSHMPGIASNCLWVAELMSIPS